MSWGRRSAATADTSGTRSFRGYRELGRIVADAHARSRAEVAREYRAKFMRRLSAQATRRTHRNVLEHMVGYFKRLLSTEEKRDLLGAIEDFAKGGVPLVAPVTLIRHFVRRYEMGYLDGQTYLQPHPKKLKLWSHV